jgi:OHCU decarboxylase
VSDQTVHDLDWLNALSSEAAQQELSKCCGATSWAESLEQHRPFASVAELLKEANEVWSSMGESDWLEAFRSHPKIGEKKAESSVTAQSQQWSTEEQRNVNQASTDATEKLAGLNHAYQEKFGFIFIVCATGKSTDEILALLQQRIGNERATELRIAAAEQAKITELRLRKLLQPS